MGTVDCAMAIKPLNRYMSESGDVGTIFQDETYCYLGLIDVLGHGAEARTVAKHVVHYLDTHYQDNPVEILTGLHDHLSGTRGAVASFCRFNLETGKLNHAGIGNITVKITGSKAGHLVSRDGIIGYRTINPHSNEATLKTGDLMIMYSDGIRSSIELLKHPAVWVKSAIEIADMILNIYGTKMDDASCIVMKYQK